MGLIIGHYFVLRALESINDSNPIKTQHFNLG